MFGQPGVVKVEWKGKVYNKVENMEERTSVREKQKYIHLERRYFSKNEFFSRRNVG